MKLQHAIARLRPGHWWDFPMAFWYAHILSGHETHAWNFGSTALNFAGVLAAKSIIHPTAIPTMAAAIARGARQSLPEIVHAVRTGAVTGPRIAQKWGDPGVWDRLKGRELWPAELKSAWQAGDITGKDIVATGTTLWKMVSRFLAAEDLFFFYPAFQLQQALLARAMARSEGLSGQPLRRKVNEILSNTEVDRSAAAVKATGEGYTGLKHRRRVEEIIQRQRDARGNFTETGREFALRVTFNNKPYGVLGVAAEAVNFVNSRLPAGKLVIPFTNIIANVNNEGLNYFAPWGVPRVLMARYAGGTLYGQQVDLTSWKDKETMAEITTKAVMGTLGLVALYAWAVAGDDDDDPWYDINGRGPSDPSKRKTWLEAGGMAYSVKLGKRRWSYLPTPLAIPLAALGNFRDAVKAGKMEGTSALDRAAFAFSRIPQTILNQNFLDSLARLLGAVEHTTPRTIGRNVADWGGRTLTSFAVPNAVRQIERIYDPAMYTALDVKGELLRTIPFARQNLKPAINGLGEPITRGWAERVTKPENPDPVWRELARLNVGVYPTRLEFMGVPLTNEQIYEVVLLSGPLIRRDVAGLTAQPQYRRWSLDLQRLAVSEMIEARHNQAKVAVVRPAR